MSKAPTLGFLALQLRRKLVSLIEHPCDNTTRSYSQAGEDRTIAFLFQAIGIANPRYLDIGANHPDSLSNTFYFYKQGCSGVCVEPNPLLWKKFKEVRPRDKVLNVGVGSQTEQSLPFYCFGPEADGLSTFSEEQARAHEAKYPYKVESVLQVPVVTLNSILDEHFKSPPDLLTIDVEGLDFEIIQSLDFTKHAPVVICAETHGLSGKKMSKDPGFTEYLSGKGYFPYADTFINTVYLREDYHREFVDVGVSGAH